MPDEFPTLEAVAALGVLALLLRTLLVANETKVLPVFAMELGRSLRAGDPFIWNATNLSTQQRGPLLSLLADYHAHVTIVSVEARADQLAARNAERRHPVPWEVIERMLERWEAPSVTECHRLEVWSG